MILVLTYHKVLREAEPKPDFYTIQPDRLEAQLDLLVRSGFEPLNPAQLLNGGPKTGRPFLLTFDDGTLDHYEVVLPILERRRLRALFFAPTARLGRPGFLTSKQVTDLHRAGHTIGLHSHEHRRLDRMMEEDIRAQMERSRQVLAELTGSLPLMFAPVGGFMDRRVKATALEGGVRVIRTMRWGYNRRCDLTRLECVPLNRFFTADQFERALQFRNLSLVYAAKQAAKRVVPGGAYEGLRALAFKLRGRRRD